MKSLAGSILISTLTACSTARPPVVYVQPTFWRLDGASSKLRAAKPENDLDTSLCSTEYPLPKDKLACYVTDQLGYTGLRKLIISLEEDLKECQRRF